MLVCIRKSSKPGLGLGSNLVKALLGLFVQAFWTLEFPSCAQVVSQPSEAGRAPTTEIYFPAFGETD